MRDIYVFLWVVMKIFLPVYILEILILPQPTRSQRFLIGTSKHFLHASYISPSILYLLFSTSKLSEYIWKYNSTSCPEDDKALDKCYREHIAWLAADELPY